MATWQAVAPPFFAASGINHQDAGHLLLLQPFTRVVS